MKITIKELRNMVYEALSYAQQNNLRSRVAKFTAPIIDNEYKTLGTKLEKEEQGLISDIADSIEDELNTIWNTRNKTVEEKEKYSGKIPKDVGEISKAKTVPQRLVQRYNQKRFEKEEKEYKLSRKLTIKELKNIINKELKTIITQ